MQISVENNIVEYWLDPRDSDYTARDAWLPRQYLRGRTYKIDGEIATKEQADKILSDWRKIRQESGGDKMNIDRPGMTIDSLKEAKAKLAKDVLALAKDFEASTSIRVRDLHLNASPAAYFTLGDGGRYIGCAIDLDM